jgi:hypothetical protein
MKLASDLKICNKCPNCGSEVTLDTINCNICHDFVGFPNVRLAQKEATTLQLKYESCMASVEAKGIKGIINDFEEAVNLAQVVMVRSFDHFLLAVGSDNALISTFHQQVAGGARLAENNDWDPFRDQVESTCHPFYHKSIHYAALSLTGFGVSSFGEAHITFRQNVIDKRTTFFQENPFDLIERLKMKMRERLPEGYRSTWEDKYKLAVCKYHSKLSASTTGDEDFQRTLLDDTSGDFIEANIYGKIHRRSFQSVSFIGMSGPSNALLSAYRGKLQEFGIKINIVE